MLRRPRIIVIISVLAALGLIAAAVLLSRDQGAKKDAYTKVCEDLIAAIAEGNYSAGYKLLSDTAKKTNTQDQWRDKTAVLSNVYRLGDVSLAKRVEVPGANEKQPLQIHLAFIVTNPIAASNLSCVAIQVDGKYQVDGFSSQLREGNEQ